MFAPNFRAEKLRVNLKLAINRLKMLQKKKTELAMKARKEIGDYLAAGKYDRARIRVEHIIREDYLVEAMEIVEMYCDLLSARMGLIECTKQVDDGLREPICSIFWVTPRLQTEVKELREISDQFCAKYGKEFALMARANEGVNDIKVNEKLMHKLSVQAPPRRLVESYLVAIAKNYNIEYEPDPMAMDTPTAVTEDLLHNEFPHGEPYQPPTWKGSGGPPGGGGGGMTCPPVQPFNYPQTQHPQMNHGGYHPPMGRPEDGGATGRDGPLSAPPQYTPSPDASLEAGYGIPPLPSRPLVMGGGQPHPPATPAPSYSDSLNDPVYPPGLPRAPATPDSKADLTVDSLPDLPAVPTHSIPSNKIGGNSGGGEDVDFDELTRRFEELKRKK